MCQLGAAVGTSLAARKATWHCIAEEEEASYKLSPLNQSKASHSIVKAIPARFYVMCVVPRSAKPPYLQLMRYLVGTGFAAGEDCRSQPEGTIISKRYSISICPELENCEYRTKNFFPVRQRKIRQLIQARACDDDLLPGCAGVHQVSGMHADSFLCTAN